MIFETIQSRHRPGNVMPRYREHQHLLLLVFYLSEKVGADFQWGFTDHLPTVHVQLVAFLSMFHFGSFPMHSFLFVTKLHSFSAFLLITSFPTLSTDVALKD